MGMFRLRTLVGENKLAVHQASGGSFLSKENRPLRVTCEANEIGIRRMILDFGIILRFCPRVVNEGVGDRLPNRAQALALVARRHIIGYRGHFFICGFNSRFRWQWMLASPENSAMFDALVERHDLAGPMARIN